MIFLARTRQKYWSGKLSATRNTYRSIKQKFVNHLHWHKADTPIFFTGTALSVTPQARLFHAAASLPHQASPAPHPSEMAEFTTHLHEYIPYKGLARDEAPCLAQVAIPIRGKLATYAGSPT
ncbi:hypothetical protein BJV78DRAFT_1158092 [Lactifluus subvellereus]|nr:hypothetical protein BJV78DRAFT_1158092 [Lactifluus subvellereus]